MKGRLVGKTSAAALAALAIGIWLITGDNSESQPGLTGEFDLSEGRSLYTEYCASCHGANLQGQPNWRSPGPDGRLPAPPHDETGHTWHHPDSLLFEYTKLGGNALMARQGMDFASGMPAFGGLLSDGEILNIIEFIKSTWPERHRTMQAERSKADRQQREK